MLIKTEQRYLGFNQYGLTGREAGKLCSGKLPKWGIESLVKNDDGHHYWIGHMNFKKTHLYAPVPEQYKYYATLTNWKLVNDQAILSYPNSF